MGTVGRGGVGTVGQGGVGTVVIHRKQFPGLLNKPRLWGSGSNKEEKQFLGEGCGPEEGDHGRGGAGVGGGLGWVARVRCVTRGKIERHHGNQMSFRCTCCEVE